jgi:hypothetical protein
MTNEGPFYVAEDADDEHEEAEDLVSLEEVNPLSREEFYERLHELRELEACAGGVDADEPEVELLVTILHLDKKYSELMRQYDTLRKKTETKNAEPDNPVPTL